MARGNERRAHARLLILGALLSVLAVAAWFALRAGPGSPAQLNQRVDTRAVKPAVDPPLTSQAGTKAGSLEDYDVMAQRLRARLEARLAREAKDSGWGTELQLGVLRVRDRVAREVRASDRIRVEASECGQTVCRVRVRHRTPDGFATIMQMAAAEPMLSGGNHWSREPRADDGTFVTVLYVARAGQALPMD